MKLLLDHMTGLSKNNIQIMCRNILFIEFVAILARFFGIVLLCQSAISMHILFAYYLQGLKYCKLNPATNDWDWLTKMVSEVETEL